MLGRQQWALWGLGLVLLAACGSEKEEPAPSAKIVSFEASETEVEEGDEVTLSWVTKHAPEVTLTANGTPIDISHLPTSSGSIAVIVMETTEFILSVPAKKGNTLTAPITVATNRVLPEILSFTATPEFVDEEDEVILAWQTKDAESLQLTTDAGDTIDISDLDVAEGSISVHPATATTYKLEASRRAHSVTREATVGIKDPPTATLTVSETLIAFGGSVELGWSTEDAETVRILRNGELLHEGSEASGFLSDAPPVTATYVLEASRAGKQTRATAKVEVTPVIESFVPASTEPLPVGTPVDLLWAVAGAVEIVVSNDAGQTVSRVVESPGSGRTSLEIGPTGTFFLEAKSGDLVAKASTETPVLQPPAIAQFEAAKAVLSADPGEAVSVTLAWSGIERATSLELVGDTIGPVDISDQAFGAGQVEVAIDADTEFTLIARNAAGEGVATKLVRLVPFPTIQRFAALPSYVSDREGFELVWEATGFAVDITENGDSIGVNGDELVGSLSLQAAESTEFELTVANEAGDTVTETVHVTVGPMENLSLSASPSYVAVGDSVTISWTNRGGRHLEIRDQFGTPLCVVEDWVDIDEGECTILIETEGRIPFDLHLSNGLGEELYESVEVLASAGPVIDHFEGTPTAVEEGDSITFSWEVRNDPHGNVPTLSLATAGKSYALDGVDPNEDSVTIPIDETGDLTFTLTASTALGTKTATFDATVHGIPVVALSASAPSYDLVTPVELSWTTEHADLSLGLYAVDENGDAIEPALYVVPEAERASGSFPVTPSAPTTYRLIAGNGLGTVRYDEVHVGIVPPAIGSLTVDPPIVNIKMGEADRTVTIAWSGVERATLLELHADTLGPIDIGALDRTADSIAIPVTETTTFTLTAENGGGTATEEVTVQGVPFAGVRTFSATPWYVEPMEPFTLVWDTFDSVEIEILADGVPVPGVSPTELSGSIVLQAPTSTYFQLRAKNVLGERTVVPAYLEVGPAAIDSFFAYPSAYLAVGESVTLGWKTLGGRALRLYKNGVEIHSTTDLEEIEEGSHVHVLTDAGVSDFVLHVDNHLGVTLEENVLVRASEGPVILDFHTDLEEYVIDEPITFTWEVLDDPTGEIPTLTLSDGTNDYDLSDKDPNLGSKAFPISVAGAYEFTLTATTSMGSSSASVVVNVFPPGPLFTSLSATPEVVPAGNTIELAWTTREINQVILGGGPYVVRSQMPFIDISATGTELALTDLCGNHSDERCADILFPPTFRPPLGGVMWDALRVMENGHAGFDLSFTGNTFGGLELPSDDDRASNAHLVPFWDDLELGNGAVFYEFGTDARGEHLIVQWHDVRFYGTPEEDPTSLNFQILLWEDGSFEYRYGTMTGTEQDRANGKEASIGYQSPGGGDHRNLHFGSSFLVVPGGLSDRGFAFLHDPLPPNGTLELQAYYGLEQFELIGVGDASLAWADVPVSVYRPMFLAAHGPDEPVLQGDPFAITYLTKFAETVRVEKVGGGEVCPDLPVSTGMDFCVVVETTPGIHAYNVIATSEVGATTVQVVEVEVVPPFEILAFDVDADEIAHGQYVTLNWTALGAQSASLTANGAEVFPAGESPNGGQLVLPLTETTTFVFTVSPPDSRPPLSASRTVVVRQFEIQVGADATSVAPGTPVTLSWNIDSPSGEDPRMFMPSAPMEEVDLLAEPSALFVDISTMGTPVPMHAEGDPDYGELVGIDVSDDDFAFPFMNDSASFFVATRSGYLTVGEPTSLQAKDRNLPLPSGNSIADGVHLAPFWGSLLPDHEVHLYYRAFTNTGGNDHLIVQWKILGSPSQPGREWNFQVVLYEDGQFEYRYGLMAPPAEPVSNGAERTIGYAMSSTQGSTLHFGGQEGMPGAPFPGLSDRTFRWRPIAGSTAVVVPHFDTSYEICGELRGYVGCASVDVEVVGIAAPVLNLSATPTELAEGEVIELSWTSTGAESVHLGSLAWMVPEETSEPFIDISATGTELDLTGPCGPELDERCAELPFPPGFRFPFAGSVQDAIRVMENGFAGFNFSFTGTHFVPSIPSGGSDNLHLAPFAADLDLTSQGAIHYVFDADARGQRLIVQWTDVRTHATPASLTFQMILWEDGAFDFRYGDMSDPDFSEVPKGRNAAIGYQVPNLAHFHALSNRVPVPGGVAHRSWAYRPLPLPPQGSLSIPAWKGMSQIDGVASGPGGEDRVSIPVTVLSLPTLHAWRVDSGPVELGEDFYIRWDAENATAVTVEDALGDVVCTAPPAPLEMGACLVLPTTLGWHTYFVKASNPGGDVVIALEVEVIPPFELLGFDVDNALVPHGGSVTLNWSAVSAVSASLQANGVEIFPVGADPNAGNLVVPNLVEKTTFEFTVFAADGRELSLSQTVLVETFELTLTPSATQVPPGTPVTLDLLVDIPGGGTPRFYLNEFEEVNVLLEPSSAFASIALTGTPLSSSTRYSTIDMAANGFSFPFGGVPQGKVQLGKNVFLNFDLAPTELVTLHEPLPSPTAYAEGVDIAPYWGVLMTACQYHYRFGTDATGRDYLLLQIHEGNSGAFTRDWNMQIALFEDGQIEFRYGSMGPAGPLAEGGSRTIGYQIAPDVGATFHYGATDSDTVPGGLSHRTIRLREVTGNSVIVTPTETTKYAVCGYLDGFQRCEVVEIETL